VTSTLPARPPDRPEDRPPERSPSLRRLRRVGEVCLWALVIGAAVVAVAHIAARLRLVVLPVLLALVLSTLLAPPTHWLRRRGVPPAVAALVAVVGGLVLVGGPIAVVAPLVVQELQDLDVGVSGGLEEIQRWLTESLGVSGSTVNNAIDRVQEEVRSNVGALTQRALTGAMLMVEILSGLALAVVVLFFLLKDGERMWGWVRDLAPPRHRDAIGEAGIRAWQGLAGFLRGQTLVALAEATLIGLALLIIGVPLVLPLAVLTFFGAYVPVLGATLAGLAATLVALFAEGAVAAALVLAAIVVVQQLEGNVLQPYIVGQSVHVHPVAVLLAVTAGAILAGIIGAMVASPLLAASSAVLAYVRERAEGDPGGD
jgi:predicted PurR-regulated permease PerM